MLYEVDFLPVGEGSGDAICIRYGTDAAGYWVHVVDGGHTDTSQRIIDHIGYHYYGSGTIINNMVLTHADDDHARGLIGVLEHFTVQNLWMNLPWLYAHRVLDDFHGNFTLAGLVQDIKDRHPYLVELETISARKGTQLKPVFQGARIGQFLVLAPSPQRYVSLIPDLAKTPVSYVAPVQGALGSLLAPTPSPDPETGAETWAKETLGFAATLPSNETSVVQMGVFGNQRVLLTADAGPVSLTEAADYAIANGVFGLPNLVQIPHHGSRRNINPTVLNRWLGNPLHGPGIAVRGYAIASVGMNKDEFPRGKVRNAFTRRGYPVYSTRSQAIQQGTIARPGWTPLLPEPFSTLVESDA